MVSCTWKKYHTNLEPRGTELSNPRAQRRNHKKNCTLHGPVVSGRSQSAFDRLRVLDRSNDDPVTSIQYRRGHPQVTTTMTSVRSIAQRVLLHRLLGRRNAKRFTVLTYRVIGRCTWMPYVEVPCVKKQVLKTYAHMQHTVLEPTPGYVWIIWPYRWRTKSWFSLAPSFVASM